MDDLIDNNTRRIKILEEMARRIWREWFIRRNGSHAVSAEWETKPFLETVEVMSGGTPRKEVKDYWGGEIPFFTPRDSPPGWHVVETAERITKTGLSHCNSQLFPAGTVFITARGTVGKLSMAGTPMAMNQSCYALRWRDGNGQCCLFMAVKDTVERLQKATGGATFDTVIIDTFRRMPLRRPARYVSSQYEDVIRPLFDEMLVLQRACFRLGTLRDALMPVLLSGYIRNYS
jgi:type I restriction enzyme S subunit